MSTAASKLRFSTESLELRDELLRSFHDRLRRRLLDRVATDHREVVTDEDVRFCAAEAFREALAEMGLPDGTTQEKAGVEYGR